MRLLVLLLAFAFIPLSGCTEHDPPDVRTVVLRFVNESSFDQGVWVSAYEGHVTRAYLMDVVPVGDVRSTEAKFTVTRMDHVESYVFRLGSINTTFDPTTCLSDPVVHTTTARDGMGGVTLSAGFNCHA